MPADTSSRCVIAFQDRPGIHVTFLLSAFAQPCAKLSSVRRRSASRYATRIETNLLRIRYETRLQFPSRNLSHDALAGIADPGSEVRIPSLLKIATATSSSVNTDVSRRRCAMFA